MKHKTWFRLVLKALGIYLIATNLNGLAMVGLWIAQVGLANISSSVSSPSPIPGEVWLQLLPPAIPIAIGIYLLFGGKWLVNFCIPSNRPYCPDCGYDVSGATERCPECGAALPEPSPTPGG